jgi:hypothetical protein
MDDPKAEAESGGTEPEVNHKAADETTWHAGKKAFVTTVIAIMLNPVSAGVGYYMNHYLQRPSLEIRYVTKSYGQEDTVFPKKVWDILQKNQAFVTQLRDGLSRQQPEPIEPGCLDWLDDQGVWQDQCMPSVKRLLRGWQKALQAELKAADENVRILTSKQDVSVEGLVPMANFRLESISLLTALDRRSAAANIRSYAKMQRDAMQLLKQLLSTLDDMSNRSDKMPLTGVVTFTVGVLNSGDRDGVVSDLANLTFEQGAVTLAADKYTAIKAHSLEEIVFSVSGDSDQGKSQAALKALVVSGQEVAFEIELDGLPKRVRKTDKL